MGKRTAVLVTAVVGLVVGFLIGNRTAPSEPAPAISEPASTSFAAVPDERGGQDITGPYEPVADWPKPLSQLPGHEGWTWGSTQGVFAESPDRVYILQRGELPDIPRPKMTPTPEVGLKGT